MQTKYDPRGGRTVPRKQKGRPPFIAHQPIKLTKGLRKHLKKVRRQNPEEYAKQMRLVGELP